MQSIVKHLLHVCLYPLTYYWQVSAEQHQEPRDHPDHERPQEAEWLDRAHDAHPQRQVGQVSLLTSMWLIELQTKL